MKTESTVMSKLSTPGRWTEAPETTELHRSLVRKGMKVSAPMAIHASKLETERDALRAEVSRLRDACEAVLEKVGPLLTANGYVAVGTMHKVRRALAKVQP